MVLLERARSNWLRILVHVGALIPLVWMAWHYWQGLFVVDPIREMTTLTGKTALILLMLSLACTPVNTVFGWKRILRVRRALGVYAFIYAALHFAIFIALDYRFDLGLVWQAIFDQQYVLVGFAAGVVLLALAFTSTRGWKRRLRRGWKRLHRLVYGAAMLVVVHFLWLSKDAEEPLRYALLLALLLILRAPWIRRAIVRGRRRLALSWRRQSFGMSA